MQTAFIVLTLAIAILVPVILLVLESFILRKKLRTMFVMTWKIDVMSGAMLHLKLILSEWKSQMEMGQFAFGLSMK